MRISKATPSHDSRLFCSVMLFPLLLLAWQTPASTAASDAVPADAAQDQDWPAVFALIEQGHDVNDAQADGTTALHWAVHWDASAAVAQLIAAGADVDAATVTRVTPLALACENGSAVAVQTLAAAGADVNVRDESSQTPLMQCVRTRNVEAVKVLLAHDADVHAASTGLGQTALMWAAAGGEASLVDLLLEGGADVAAVSDGGFTALTFAVRSGDLDTVRTLVEHGSDVNRSTPVIPADDMYVGYWLADDHIDLLPLAIMTNNVPVALYLLEQGADPNQRAGGMSALHHAVYGIGQNTNLVGGGGDGSQLVGRIEIVRALLDHGADPNARQTAAGIIGFHGDPKQGAWGQMGWGTTRIGATPFYLAADCSNANPELMRILLEYGADPTLTTEDGTTPLMAAAGLGWGYNPPTDDARERMLAGVKFLTEEVGADVNAANFAGFTPLHGAAYKGSIEIITYLVEHGAEMDVRDYRGRTPYRLAQWSRNSTDFWQWPDAAERLIELGANPRLGVDARVQERELARAVSGEPPMPDGASGPSED